MLDIEQIRRDTPGCDEVIHFNNAGSSLPPAVVVDAMVDYLRTEAVTGGYEIAADRADGLAQIYDSTAQYLGCEPSEVAFVSSAGDAWWRAFASVTLEAGDRILISHAEYQANAFAFLQAAERGVEVQIVPNDADGLIDVEALGSMLDERVKLVSLTHVSMSNGAIQPAADVGRAVADHPAVFLLDSCQAAGQMPLDVDQLGCDFLAYTGRKWMRGPRGTGILYARSSVLDRLGPPTFLDGRSATWNDDNTYTLEPGAMRFEFGEQHFSGKIGLDVATRYMLDVGVDAIAARVGELSSRLRNNLGELPEVTICDEGGPRGGAVTFMVRGEALPASGQALRAQGLNLSVPGRSNAQYDLGHRGIEAVFRAAAHYFNTEAEVDKATELIAGL